MNQDDSPLTKIIKIMQRGRIKPAKYKHSLTIPCDEFEYLHKLNIIDIEFYYIDESIFFEFNEDVVILNFRELFVCQDIHIRSLSALLAKHAGRDPILRSGEFKMKKK